MTDKEQEPIAFFLVTKFQFVCPDCLSEGEKEILTFYEEDDVVGYYNDLNIGFHSQEHERAAEGKPLTISCDSCNKNLAKGSLTHELSDMFDDELSDIQEKP